MPGLIGKCFTNYPLYIALENDCLGLDIHGQTIGPKVQALSVYNHRPVCKQMQRCVIVRQVIGTEVIPFVPNAYATAHGDIFGVSGQDTLFGGQVQGAAVLHEKIH